MEKRSKCNVFMIELECECSGLMKYTGLSKPGIDQKSMLFQHRCMKCNKIQEVKNKQYPQMEYRKETD